MTDRVEPFSNGTEYMDWLDYNCGRCKRLGALECDIEAALDNGAWGDGTVSATIAQRAGYDGTWPRECKERKAQ